ncbi:hypothetical protein [Actinoplanes sp. N902-109]|uniref:hypothetical protein n=1 Tax=Actinoplanes sp. (strain N902-109) TaxID=649831 RepID=UPI00032949EF|nr:hypothetical protein [Actinoplanes sp. N902-109]AGL20144.1 hypothetical protein L083_6634 [Actinoplanes sp. N902-109]
MSVVILIVAGIIGTIAYRMGRTHAAPHDWRAARRDVPAKRRYFWGLARPLLLGGLFLLTTFLVAAYDAGH